MARYQFQGIFHDGNGKVVSDGTISVYLAGTTTVASVYTASSGGTAVNSVTSDSSGVFSFWVDDSDYGITQLFKLVLSMTNFETKTYDNIFVCAQTSSLVDLTTAQTLTNKTLTSPILTTPLINDGDTGLSITSTNQTHAAPTATIPNIGDAADTFVMADTAQTLTNKTLTSPILTTPLINDGDTGLTITSANQTHAAPTATVPDIVDAADTFVMADTTQTLTNKTLTSPVINVSSDAEGDTYYRNSSGTLARLAKGTNGQILSQVGNVPAWISGTSKWVNLIATTDFTTTAASTSTITMNTDQTANILVGYAIKFTLSGVVYYAQCTAIASNLLTIRGAPLTTGAGALTALSYSPLPSQVMELYLPVDGYYEDATESALLLNDMRYQYKWNLSKAYVVAISHMQRVVDTGTESNVNVMVNSAAVCTANTNQGRAMSSSADTWVATDIDISTSNYDINYGETIEIQATKAGNGDARDLTVSVVLVFP